MKSGQASHDIELQENNNSTNSTPQITTTTTATFPNYPHHPRFLSTPPHLLPLRQFPPLQQNPQTTPIQSTPSSPKRPKITPTTSSEDNSTIDSSRRSTGRPRGSKNKPKPPIIVTQKPQPGLTPYIIEIPSGSDLVTRLTRLTQQRGVSLCILSATGAVNNVTLKQPSTSVPGGTVMFRGKFDILSLSACLLTNATSYDVGFSGVFTITLSGPHGQIIGGKVVGPLVCAGVVYVVASSFSNPDYTRLPIEADDGGGVGSGSGNFSSSPDCDGDGDCDTETGGGYRGNSGEVLWAPAPLAARPPQPRLN